jgi:iron complex transport system substrate-binding protein
MRIASLLPSGTELVAALGLADDLVGVSHECDYPPGVERLPRLTSSILDGGRTPAEIDAAVARASLEAKPLYAVDAALLSSLKPEVLVTQGVCSVCAVTEETIEGSLALLPLEAALDVPVVSLSGQSWEGVRRDIVTLARALDEEAAAGVLLAELDSRWEALVATAAEVPATRVAMLEWPDPPWFAGHWVPEQVAAAGGTNLFGTAGAPSGRLAMEDLVSADPDVVVGIACGYGVEENRRHLAALLDRPQFAGLRAAREGRIWAADANGLFSRPGPRLVEGAELLRRIFTAKDVDARQAVRLS